MWMIWGSSIIYEVTHLSGTQLLHCMSFSARCRAGSTPTSFGMSLGQTWHGFCGLFCFTIAYFTLQASNCEWPFKSFWQHRLSDT